MIFQYGDLLGRRKKDLLFDAGYRAAIDDMQDNLIRNSRTERRTVKDIIIQKGMY